MVIRNKAEMYERYFAGEFGNKLRTWETLADLFASDYTGPVTIRYREQGAPFCKYDVPFDLVGQAVLDFQSKGASVDKMTFNETIDTDSIVFQCEVQRDQFYLSLRYSLAPIHMRAALESAPRHAFGLRANAILRHYLCPSSYEDLQAIFDRYPDSVVEMTTVSGNIGSTPNRNTVFWEVRNY